jgi:hypothetical protein
LQNIHRFLGSPTGITEASYLRLSCCSVTDSISSCLPFAFGSFLPTFPLNLLGLFFPYWSRF